MITCKPIGICSWNFRLQGERRSAILSFNWTGEQGFMRIGEFNMEVQKHGTLSGHWTLECAGARLASAQKTSAFTRTFDVEDSSGLYRLHAVSAFGRNFQVQFANKKIATISPDHAFTRRASIQVNSDKLDFVTTSFMFWLTVLMWRRASKQSN